MRKRFSFFNHHVAIHKNTELALFMVMLVLSLVFACNEVNKKTTGDTSNNAGRFGFGRAATDSDIKRLNIDIRPDGKGLPAGSGTAAVGALVYAQKCTACHGLTGIEGPQNKLVGVIGDTGKAKTIGNYWPYATTVFDYIRRTMPYNQPGTLTDNETYSLTAFLLYRNKIIDSTKQLDAHSLPHIVMPAQHLFVNDDRKGGREIK